jgi:hypothetical protein
MSCQLFISENPQYLCCSKYIFEGEFNYSNFEHNFIAVSLASGDTDERKVKRSLLENAICTSLNHDKGVVIAIGIS